MPSHSAVKVIRSALKENSFTSGTCKIPVEHCDLYYKLTPTSTACLNLATASESELAQLISACDAAPFGRGNQTVIDETYRKALKLELSQFALPFDLASTPIVNKIYQDLVASGNTTLRVVRAEPYKLNIYDKGAFFKAHQDTPRADNMFGSLVLIFPTAHEGGALVLRERGKKWPFDASEMLANSSPDAPEVAYVAFYSDTEHEVLPVTSGARVTLTYNLYFEDAADFLAITSIPNAKHVAVKNALQQLVDDAAFLPRGGRLCFGLAHQYSIKKDAENDWRKRGETRLGHTIPELARYLKGSDAIVYSACRELGLDVQVKVLYVDDDYHGVYLGSTPIQDVPCEVDDVDYLYKGLEVIRPANYDSQRKEDIKEDKVELVWVTPKSKLNRVGSAWIAYGNEASLEYLYGDVVLSVELLRASRIE